VKRPKAGDRGILLGDYLKYAVEPFVRGQLDRGELRYTWTDSKNNARASDDGEELPPKGWWPRPEFTKIDYERHSVWGNVQIPPTFPPMYFVKVYPVVAPKAKAKGRPGIKSKLVAEILAAIDQRKGLAPHLQPADIERMVLPEFRRRWAKHKPDDDTEPPVSRREIVRTYKRYFDGK
jgi:hypothetical protein